ncbi:hypothetical protein NEFER03_1839 [Nematocida sp. LUAm3]|nr:hypothetical protein NEFER03_1839 [Nematocida sp. LUAm3]KAI5173850.1 hypothetical protein NEFER02_0317 [Nematocida sp. LUAm2]
MVSLVVILILLSLVNATGRNSEYYSQREDELRKREDGLRKREAELKKREDAAKKAEAFERETRSPLNKKRRNF